MEKYHIYLTGTTIIFMGVYMCNKQIALVLNYQWINNNVFEIYKYFTATITNRYMYDCLSKNPPSSHLLVFRKIPF